MTFSDDRSRLLANGLWFGVCLTVAHQWFGWWGVGIVALGRFRLGTAADDVERHWHGHG